MLKRNTQLLVALIALASTQVHADIDLQITEIWPGNDPGENLSADWFEITNQGDMPWITGTSAPLFYDDESADPNAADPITGIASIQPGEAIIVLVSDEGDAAINEFFNLWSAVYDLETVQIGLTDGAGLGQGGDAVTLFLGGPSTEAIVDVEAYPDANDFGGQSYDVDNQQFSASLMNAATTIIVNDAGQPAIGTPGNQGPIEIVGNPPQIQLLGDNPLLLQRNDVFVDPGAIAQDAEDGDISANIVISGDFIDTNNFGNFEIQYEVSDSDGNAAAPALREVVVTHPQRIPFAPAPANPNLFTQVATLGNLPGAEIATFDAFSKQAYITSGDGLQIVDLKDPRNPIATVLIDPSQAPFHLNSAAITSVDSCRGLVAFAVPDAVQTNNGSVVLTDNQGGLVNIFTVGALPDMITFTNDCRKILTANEGEPEDGIDPEGSISIIDLNRGTVKTVDFRRFNGREQWLQKRGVRLFPGIAAANDLEPEYIAISNDNRFAYVTLQEANAIAVVSIRLAKVISILPLGLKDHSLPGNELDASDRDSVVNIQNWPLTGMFMPDAIDSFGRGHNQFYITANEGDARDADARVNSLVLDPTIFPNAEELQNDFNIGRIEVSTIDGDLDGDGDFDRLQAYGARSFSIWNQWGQLIFDSGNQIEAIVASQTPDNYDDGRSDNKGPEPEGIEVGAIGRDTYAFIGLERSDQVLVYDISNPYYPTFVQILQTAGDDAPEGLKFLSKKESPNRCPSLLVTNEDSNTLTIYQVSNCAF